MAQVVKLFPSCRSPQDSGRDSSAKENPTPLGLWPANPWNVPQAIPLPFHLLAHLLARQCGETGFSGLRCRKNVVEVCDGNGGICYRLCRKETDCALRTPALVRELWRGLGCIIGAGNPPLVVRNALAWVMFCQFDLLPAAQA